MISLLWRCVAIAVAGGLTLAPATSTQAREITVGVGSLTNTFDFTSESFNLHRHLRERFEGSGIEVVLVDHPGDADVAVSGVIRGSYTQTSLPPPFDWPTFLLSLSVVGAPIAMIRIVTMEPVLDYDVHYRHSVDLKFWVNGRRNAVASAPYGEGAELIPDEVLSGVRTGVEGENAGAEARIESLRPLFDAIGDKLEGMAAEGGA